MEFKALVSDSIHCILELNSNEEFRQKDKLVWGILFMKVSIKMLKKKDHPRKRKRIVKRVLFFSVFTVGLVSFVSCCAYYFISVKLNQPLYLSPLASMKFVQASQEDKKIAVLKSELTKENIAFSKIEKANDSGYVVQLQKGGSVTFSSQKDIITQIASLQYILSHLTMEDRQFTRLDLRFEKPVIVLKK